MTNTTPKTMVSPNQA